MVFELKSMVGWGEHKGVLDESGFRAHNKDADWGLNFLSVKHGSINHSKHLKRIFTHRTKAVFGLNYVWLGLAQSST